MHLDEVSREKLWESDRDQGPSSLNEFGRVIIKGYVGTAIIIHITYRNEDGRPTFLSSRIRSSRSKIVSTILDLEKGSGRYQSVGQRRLCTL